ncbi:formyl transferase [Citrifermentans bremense]|uniref:formyl transferase n=1 Tax=Citrifermentans bremense TaxID=60035 RepID=UPI00047C56D4|nr:formyl transferase [Citrifermentans bremense]
MIPLKVVLVVSMDPSDLYFANQLARRLNAAGVVVESQGAGSSSFWRRSLKAASLCATPWKLPGLLRERGIVAEHLRRTGAIDRAGFGAAGYRLALPDGCTVHRAQGKGALHAPQTLETVRGWSPDLLVLCGCSILKAEFLSIPRLGTLNLHGGLAQRYRGVWTTLWAVVNREPEYVGATVHFVSPGIDDGDIVHQGRPELEPHDDPESLYVKVVKLGIEMMASAVAAAADGSLRRYPLQQRGELYLSRMVTPQVLQQAWQATEQGVVRDYLAHKQERDRPVLTLMRGAFNGQGGSDGI